MNKFFFSLAFFMTGTATLAEEHLNCWDGTFSYSWVKVDKGEETVKIEMTSQDLGIFKPLLTENFDDNWGEGKFMVEIPRAQCAFSEKDYRMSCRITSKVQGDLSLTGAHGGISKNFKLAMQDDTLEIVNVSRIVAPTGVFPETALQLQIVHFENRNRVRLFKGFPLVNGKCKTH